MCDIELLRQRKRGISMEGDCPNTESHENKCDLAQEAKTFSKTLSPVDEQKIIKWILEKHDVRLTLNWRWVCQHVKNYLDSNFKIIESFQDNKPNDLWCQTFVKRHPKLRQTLSKSKCLTHWFDSLHSAVDSPTLNDPSLLYVCGVVEFCIDINIENVGLTHKNKNCCASAVITYSANSHFMAPLVLLPGKLLQEHGDGSSQGHQNQLTSEKFEKWLTGVFIPSIKNRNLSHPVLLLTAKLEVLSSQHAVDLCKQANIILYHFPSEGHFINPLDLLLYPKMKSDWIGEINSYAKEVQMSQHKFAAAFRKVFRNITISGHAKESFQLAGIFPQNYSLPLKYLFDQMENKTRNDEIKYETIHTGHDVEKQKNKCISGNNLEDESTIKVIEEKKNIENNIVTSIQDIKQKGIDKDQSFPEMKSVAEDETKSIESEKDKKSSKSQIKGNQPQRKSKRESTKLNEQVSKSNKPMLTNSGDACAITKPKAISDTSDTLSNKKTLTKSKESNSTQKAKREASKSSIGKSGGSSPLTNHQLPKKDALPKSKDSNLNGKMSWQTKEVNPKKKEEVVSKPKGQKLSPCLCTCENELSHIEGDVCPTTKLAILESYFSPQTIERYRKAFEDGNHIKGDLIYMSWKNCVQKVSMQKTDLESKFKTVTKSCDNVVEKKSSYDDAVERKKSPLSETPTKYSPDRKEIELETRKPNKILNSRSEKTMMEKQASLNKTNNKLSTNRKPMKNKPRKDNKIQVKKNPKTIEFSNSYAEKTALDILYSAGTISKETRDLKQNIQQNSNHWKTNIKSEWRQTRIAESEEDSTESESNSDDDSEEDMTVAFLKQEDQNLPLKIDQNLPLKIDQNLPLKMTIKNGKAISHKYKVTKSKKRKINHEMDEAEKENKIKRVKKLPEIDFILSKKKKTPEESNVGERRQRKTKQQAKMLINKLSMNEEETNSDEDDIIPEYLMNVTN